MNSFLNQEEIYLFNEGTYYHCYQKFGAHRVELNGEWGIYFALWAPNAAKVEVVGDFNHWQGNRHQMIMRPGGVWVLFVPGLGVGEKYKYRIITEGGATLLKADPFAFYSEVRPATASLVYSLEGYFWGDGEWMAARNSNQLKDRPFNIYEVHLGSWRRKKDGSFYNYRELAQELIPYAKEMGFTHLELLPLMEHPYDGSWGYQVTGYYAVTSRYGNPHDFMYFVDQCHRAGLGVILDWVPGHFCKDAHGLGLFDGGNLFDKEEHVEWGTYTFDFSRNEVWSFLIGNALFWLDKYHLDGLRVDGVTSMLFLDYGKHGQPWQPNIYGGRENLEAITFLQKLNETVAKYHPDVLMIAEESTDWPYVTKPVSQGGLGFHYKWNMGWMNDTLRYVETDFPWRSESHNLLTFSMIYAFAEDFILPLSHDEVVHGKKSLIGKMPGDYWQQFAGLRALYCYQLCHPGKKLFFMGGEFAQFVEWRYYEELEWFLLDYPMHRQFQHYVRTFNHLYLREKSLWQQDGDWKGFQWCDPDNRGQSVFSFYRKSAQQKLIVVLLNFKPEYYPVFRVGVPEKGDYEEILNSDHQSFGGSGQINERKVTAEAIPYHGQQYSIEIKLPPLAGVLLKLIPAYN
jgi:1,4-alpha-glucan branching enzyme